MLLLISGVVSMSSGFFHTFLPIEVLYGLNFHLHPNSSRQNELKCIRNYFGLVSVDCELKHLFSSFALIRL
jgi:hypothetical protein